MAVDQADVIDIVTRAPDGSCILSISDHLEWDITSDHLLILQAKMNRYLAFIESGELLEKLPEYLGAKTIIRLYCKYEPDIQGRQFLDLARYAIEGAGFGFDYRVGL